MLQFQVCQLIKNQYWKSILNNINFLYMINSVLRICPHVAQIVVYSPRAKLYLSIYLFIYLFHNIFIYLFTFLKICPHVAQIVVYSARAKLCLSFSWIVNKTGLEDKINTRKLISKRVRDIIVVNSSSNIFLTREDRRISFNLKVGS